LRVVHVIYLGISSNISGTPKEDKARPHEGWLSLMCS
jgi:hypothetical protein